MRAALLPAGSDPFLLAYWLRNYKTWADQVDELRIVVCGENDPSIVDYLTDLVVQLPNILIRFIPRTDHGEVIKQLIEDTPADIVLLCEDDAFVRRPEKVGNAFKRVELEEVDIVGSPRATGSDGILNWARRRYGDWVASTGECGPILWPCFLFAKKADLLQTDRCFGAWGRPAGRSMMGQTFPTDEAMDTFGWATLQLREMGLRFHIEGNYRSQLECLAQWTDAPWFHVGGLSAGHGNYLLGDEANKEERFAAIRNDPYDWQKRMSWWQRVTEKWDGVLVEHRNAYLREIEECIVKSGMNREEIARWSRGFDGLISWQE